MNKSNYISVFLDDEDTLRQAVKRLLEHNETIIDVQSPFPVHGMDKLLSIRRTRIPVGGFIFGFIGAISAFGFMTWVFTVSYPLVIGGKPYFAAPSFIPITFEMTVLFSGLAMAAALLIRSGLKPEIFFKPIDERITDDFFTILVSTQNGNTTTEKIETVLSGIKLIEIRS